MKGIRPIELVLLGLEGVNLPPLAKPQIIFGEQRTEETIQWATKFYAYSVIAHTRKVLTGLTLLANAQNVPVANLVSRHVFEWTAQMCYMSGALEDCFTHKDWEKAREILTPAAIGNMWATNRGAKYVQPSDPPLPTAPVSRHILKAVKDYENYQLREHGWQDAKDSYHLLSEYCHPNAACLQQYHTYRNDGSTAVDYVEFPNGENSPLPFVNRYLIDLMLFVDKILQLAADTDVRARMLPVMVELVKLAPKTKT
jgi:hypothetical protein